MLMRITELEATIKAMSALEDDAARMDWIESHASIYRFSAKPTFKEHVGKAVILTLVPGAHTVRDAIDIAMDNEKANK